MNSANKIVDSLAKLNTDTSNEILYMRVKTLSPLTFAIDERLSIGPDFYILSKFENWNNLRKGDRVLAFSFNKKQKFYIAERYDFHNY